MIETLILDGAKARDLVDPLYVKNGKSPCARDSDVFFVAMDGSTLLGCVRYCVEEGTPMLRTMLVDAAHRRRWSYDPSGTAYLFMRRS
jgi:hypothetical protein